MQTVTGTTEVYTNIVLDDTTFPVSPTFRTSTVILSTEVITATTSTESQSYVYAVGSGVITDISTEIDIYTEYNDYFPPNSNNPTPTCSFSYWNSCTQLPNCGVCTIQGATVQLLYWPVATGAPNATNATTTHGDTGPITASYENTILTSPTVYISFETAYALNDCNSTVGKEYPGAILAMDPASVSSVIGGIGALGGVTIGTSTIPLFYESASFDYADLNFPVPPAAYYNQPRCFAEGCETIYNDYNPVLVVPSQIRQLDPAWSTCTLFWG